MIVDDGWSNHEYIYPVNWIVNPSKLDSESLKLDSESLERSRKPSRVDDDKTIIDLWRAAQFDSARACTFAQASLQADINGLSVVFQAGCTCQMHFAIHTCV